MKNNKTKSVAAGAKRGRKPRVLSFKFAKNRPFTVLDVYNRYVKGNSISKVAITNKLKAMLAGGNAKVVGKVNSGHRGRPFLLFKLSR